MLKDMLPDEGKRNQIPGSDCVALERINVSLCVVTVVIVVRIGAILFQLYILSGIWKSTNSL